MRRSLALLLALAAAACAADRAREGGAPSARAVPESFLPPPRHGFFSDAYLPGAAQIFFESPQGSGASFSGGIIASRFGGATFFSDGITAIRNGGLTTFSNGLTATTFGDAVLFSDGRICRRLSADLSCF